MIVDELEHIVHTYNPGVILFVDEIPDAAEEAHHEMCDEILRRGLKFEWDREHARGLRRLPALKHMPRAVAGGSLRLESGSQRMLDV